MEANRILHDPVVEIYSNRITPGVCCSAEAYDLANRRWYQLNVADKPGDAHWHHDTQLEEVPEDEWLSSTVEKHIKEHYRSTAALPPWNTISTNSSGFPVTFDLTEETLVRRPISEKFRYYGLVPKSSGKFPTITFTELQEKAYLSRGVDYCLWRGRKCVFKRIEFDCDVKSHRKEIRTREALLRCMKNDLGNVSDDQAWDSAMETQFHVVPILAVVLHDKKSTWILSRGTASAKSIGEVAGFLTPYAGESLERLAMPAAGSGTPGLMASNIPIKEGQLLDLARGVQNLSRCGRVHGGICFRNVVLTGPNPSQDARLLLINIGDIAPDYKGDAYALGDLLLWCMGHSAELRDTATRKKIVVAATLAMEGDLDRAIGVLAPIMKATGSSFKSPA